MMHKLFFTVLLLSVTLNTPYCHTSMQDDEVTQQKIINPTALHDAAKEGNLILVKQLLDDIDINAQDLDGKTALHIAIENTLPTLAFFLIDHGADVNIPSFNYWNSYPLHVATITDQKKVVEKLLQAGARVNQRSAVGKKTALHKACAMGLFDIVAILIKYGANVSLVDSNNRTALYMAQQNNWGNIVTLLQKHGAKHILPNSPCPSDNEETIIPETLPEEQYMKHTTTLSYNIGIPTEDKSLVVTTLQVLLADEFILYTKTLNAHWNVTGPHFGPLHLLFKENYEILFQMVDDVAERIRTLGFASPASATVFLDDTQLSELKTKTTDGQELIAILYNDHLTIIRSLRTAIKTCQELNDEGTANFLTDLMETQEKAAWMLRAHLE